jgi:hypothetical protein
VVGVWWEECVELVNGRILQEIKAVLAEPTDEGWLLPPGQTVGKWEASVISQSQGQIVEFDASIGVLEGVYDSVESGDHSLIMCDVVPNAYLQRFVLTLGCLRWTLGSLLDVDMDRFMKSFHRDK